MPAPCAHVAQDLERLAHGARHLLGANARERVREPREHERVDPLAVGGALDHPEDSRIDVLEQVVAHAREVVQVAVLREREARALEQERVHVLQADRFAAVVDDAAHVRDQRRRSHLARERAQVAVEVGDRRHPVGERPRRLRRAGVPGGEAEPAEVEQRHQLGVDSLVDERAVRLVEEILEQHGLTQIRSEPTHHAPSRARAHVQPAAVWLRPSPNGSSPIAAPGTFDGCRGCAAVEPCRCRTLAASRRSGRRVMLDRGKIGAWAARSCVWWAVERPGSRACSRRARSSATSTSSS